jgi:hypothetical protein
MKMTKAQEDFLGICWKMKVINIMPQAAKLGIPEAEVRKYLGKMGLTIDQGGFVFQGTKLEVESEARITADEFMAAVGLVNGEYQKATGRFLKMQRRMGDRSLEVMKAREEAWHRRDDMVWLISGLLTPASKEHASLAQKAARKLLGKSGGRETARSPKVRSQEPIPKQNAADRSR